jgi:carboxynorspermidine decarboxylase
MTTFDYSSVATPCFLLEESRLLSNLQLMRRVQAEASIQIIVAFKGFSMWSTFPLVRQYLAGATASSLYEAMLCFEEMGSRAHSYAAVYMPDEIEQMAKLSSHLTFNSLTEAERYHQRIIDTGEPVLLGLRLNPEYSPVETDLYNPTMPGSRLGIAAEKVADGMPSYISGLHFHNLCESTSYDLERTMAQIEHLYGHLLPNISWINFGGGHLMTRQGYDIEHLIGILKAFRLRWPNIIEVTLEPGSAVGWDCGPLISRVLDIVEHKGIKTLMMDCSFTAHMPDTLEMPYRPRIREAHEELIEGKPTYRIGGTSCLSGDYMAEYSFDRDIEVGDMLFFEDMMHYTMVKTSMFNGVKHPDIAILDLENKYKLVRRFTYLDFKRRLS